MKFYSHNCIKFKILIILMKFYQNVNATPLSLAVEKGNIEIVQLLLSRKDIDINLIIV